MPESPTRRNRRRAVVIGATAALTIPLVGVAAVAAVPDAQGVFHGCFVKSTGVLRVIDPASTNTSRNRCKSTETAITWNQRGPQGIPGAAGADGAPGPEGPQGPPGQPGGLSGLTRIHFQAAVPPPSAPNTTVSLGCGPDKAVLNVGYTVQSGSVTVVSSAPVTAATELFNVWMFTLRGGATGGVVDLTATCADAVLPAA